MRHNHDSWLEDRNCLMEILPAKLARSPRFHHQDLTDMKETEGLSPRDEQFARQLIQEAAALSSIPRRIDLISARLLGLPYIVHPLIGSATVPEQMTARLDGFDCVTFVETVLALATSRSVERFVERLRELRYASGQVNWHHRLHYMTEWSAANIQRGFLKDMTLGEGAIPCTRQLSYIAGLPPRTAHFRYFPKTAFEYTSRWLTDGDLIFFVSQNRHLDTYHVGLLVRRGETLLLRHARHMRHRVYEQPLAEFLRVSKTPGFIINRVNY